MKITITNHSTHERVEINRDVCTSHPDWVHQQMGTHSELELQSALDQCSAGDWYDEHGAHLGPDSSGVEMWRGEPFDLPTAFDRRIESDAKSGLLNKLAAE